ncbi:hypothetical protein, partial [Klebsiella pneumoniae]|uniref:hypothetical protein n=2 Tax=Klebsiella pneumoniae TaxID=573 RepID=UPI0024B337A4
GHGACVEQDDKGWDARKRAYCLKIQPATGSFARNLIYSTKPKRSCAKDLTAIIQPENLSKPSLPMMEELRVCSFSLTRLPAGNSRCLISDFAEIYHSVIQAGSHYNGFPDR